MENQNLDAQAPTPEVVTNSMGTVRPLQASVSAMFVQQASSGANTAGQEKNAVAPGKIKKWIFRIVGAIVLSIAALATLGFWVISGPKKAANEFFADLARNDINGAYALMVPVSADSTQSDFEGFTAHIKNNPKLGEVKGVSYSDAEIDGDHAKLNGTARLADGTTATTTVDEIKVGGAWRIASVTGLDEPANAILPSPVSGTAATYNGQTYTLGYADTKDMNFYEFYPPGETSDSWTKLMTMVAYQKNGASVVPINKDTAMTLASNVLSEVKKSKGLVFGSNKYNEGEAVAGSPETYIILYALPDYEKKSMELDLQKFYIENGVAKMVGYGELLPLTPGQSDKDFEKTLMQKQDELFATEKDFVGTTYAFPPVDVATSTEPAAPSSNQ